MGQNGKISIQLEEHNFAHQLIEEFMIVSNTAVAEHFKNGKVTSLRRVVRTPKHWDQIVELAKKLGETLPNTPDALALDAFLIKQLQTSPDTFPDLSLSIIKLLGRGEYVVETGDDAPIGHFALALINYTHFTAPNRRYPDLISHRQYKAFLENRPLPYSLDDLTTLAEHCTAQEDAATKVERQVDKSAAAILLSDKIGTVFPGIVSGANEKGTWVRIFDPPIEGKLVKGFQNLVPGDHVSVKLQHVDINKGFIDFAI
jgi:exoribonuclease-2